MPTSRSLHFFQWIISFKVDGYSQQNISFFYTGIHISCIFVVNIMSYTYFDELMVVRAETCTEAELQTCIESSLLQLWRVAYGLVVGDWVLHAACFAGGTGGGGDRVT